MALRIVVIGLGKQSTENHLPALRQSKKFELVAVCDVSPERAAEIGSAYNVPGYTDIDQLIREQDFEAAIVSVPHCEYLKVIKALADAGKHIIKEKPFATSVAEAKLILEMLRKGHIYLGVTVQRRFNPIYQTFHQLKKYIGKIYSVEGAYTMNIASLDTGWRSSKELAGGGALGDMGYHFIDLLIWYFGMPSSVTARLTRGNRVGQHYDVEDTAHLLFEYELGHPYDEKMIGNFVISRVYPEKKEQVRIFGDQGIIEVSRGMIRRLDTDGKEIEHLERQGGWPSAAVEQLDHFAEKIAGFVPGSVQDYDEHLQHVAVIEAAYESDRLDTSCRPDDFLKIINASD